MSERPVAGRLLDCAQAGRAVETSRSEETFRGLLLRLRGRLGMTQGQLAERIGVNRRSLQDWEAGVNHPAADRLHALISALLESGGFSPGSELLEAQTLWAAVERDSARMHTPFDTAWFARMLGERAATSRAPRAAPGPGPERERRQDWGEAPGVRDFVGRTEELGMLRGWMLEEQCRLVAILGMGGIGKTSLAARLAHDVAPDFERVYWRSLRDALPTEDWLAGAIGFLSDQQVVPPRSESARITSLLEVLRERRSLLVLDNFETVLEPALSDGRFRAGLGGYRHLVQALGETMHQSCLVLVSREAPAELAIVGGGPVRSLHLSGLGVDETRVLLAPKQLVGTGQNWAEFVERLGGNGLAVKILGETIRELFGGDIGAFLEEPSTVFGGIRRLLAEQVKRASAAEQQVLRRLAVEREPMQLTTLLATLGSRAGRGVILEAIDTLGRRSLVERAEASGAVAFTLQSVVLEYVTDRLVDEVATEIHDAKPLLLIEQPVIKAQAKEYVRQTQERLIGGLVLQQLVAQRNEPGTEQRLLMLLDGWRGRPPDTQGFGPGNVVNLLRLLRGNLRGLDLSHLVIRQPYLSDVEAQDAVLVGTYLKEAVLADAFGLPVSIGLSADASLLAAGMSAGEVWLWRVADRTLMAVLVGHTAVVQSLSFAADGPLLASGSHDGTVRLWDTNTGQPIATLSAHPGGVWGVALSSDGQLLATGGADGTVRLWERGAPAPRAILEGHTGIVYSVALSGDGHLVASGGFEGTMQLWDGTNGLPVATLHGYTGLVRGVALSADGRLVAGGGVEGMVRLWDSNSARPVATLQGQTGAVSGVALSPDSQWLASSGIDGTVRLWEASTWERPTGRFLVAVRGHSGGVWSVALSADGELVASGGEDGIVRVWHTGTGRPLASLEGHAGVVWSVAITADGRLLASGSEDGSVRLWELPSGQLLATLQGHSSAVWSVALAATGRLLLSSGADGAIRLWDPTAGHTLASLPGHTGGVYAVALTPDGDLAASGGGDGTLRLWDVGTEQPLASLQGHAGVIRAVAVSADGHLVATGGWDGTVRLWDPRSGTAVRTLRTERRYERMDITGMTGISDAQHTALLALGAVDRSNSDAG